MSTKSLTKAELVALNVQQQNRIIALEGSVRAAQRTIEDHEATIEALSTKLRNELSVSKHATKKLSVTRQQMLAAREEAMKLGKVVLVKHGG